MHIIFLCSSLVVYEVNTGLSRTNYCIVSNNRTTFLNYDLEHLKATAYLLFINPCRTNVENRVSS